MTEYILIWICRPVVCVVFWEEKNSAGIAIMLPMQFSSLENLICLCGKLKVKKLIHVQTWKLLMGKSYESRANKDCEKG